MIRKTLLLLVLGVLLAVPAAFADTATLVYTGQHGPGYHGWYISPYGGQLNGTPVALYCDDFAHRIYANLPFTVNVNSLPAPNLPQLMYGGLPNATTMYLQAAWLVASFNQNPGDIQLALWNLFNSNAPDTVASNWWLAQSAIHYGDFNYNGFRILTDVNKNYQEFIITPEPTSLVTFGSGLIAVAALIRRRFGR